MSRLDELESSPDVGRPERTVTVCTAGRLVRELEQVDADLFAVEQELEAERVKVAAAAEGEPVGPPQRAGQSRSRIPELEARAQELAEKADGIRDRMKAANVDLLLRAVEPHEWRAWVAAHPARDEDEDPAGAARDQRWAAAFCNIDALIADLGKYIAEYDGEAPSDRWWKFISSKVAPGALTKAASTVVGLHEQVTDLGKSRVSWLSARRSVNVSE